MGRTATKTDGNASQTTYSYDEAGRKTRESFADGTQVDYVYDPDGNLTSRSDGSGTSTYAYDLRGQLVSESLPTGTHSYSYDGAGKLLSLTDAGGAVGYAYGPGNLLASITEPGGSQTRFSYDSRANLLQTAYPNGVTVDRSYDGSDKLLLIAAKSSNASVLRSFAYTYAVGAKNTDVRQSATEQDGKAVRYTYDNLGRLVRAVRSDGTPQDAVMDDWQYGYDGAGNRTTETHNGTTTSYSYNDANELTQAGATTYGYDPEGNETSTSTGRNSTHNARNQRTSVTPPGGAPIGSVYAGADQTIRTNVGGATYDQNALGLGAVGFGASAIYYTRTPSGEVVGQRTPTGRQYLLKDALGSVLGVTDQAGQLVGSATYDPFGKAMTQTGTTSAWGFAGEYRDSAGLYKIGHRYYDPSTGRWTQRDPLDQVADPEQANRYVYGGADPVNQTDPSGMWFGSRLVKRVWKQGKRYVSHHGGMHFVVRLVAGAQCGSGVSTFRHDSTEARVWTITTCALLLVK